MFHKCNFLPQPPGSAVGVQGAVSSLCKPWSETNFSNTFLVCFPPWSITRFWSLCRVWVSTNFFSFQTHEVGKCFWCVLHEVYKFERSTGVYDF